VLRDVMFGDRRHFRDLQRSNEEGIASNVLASRLRDLGAPPANIDGPSVAEQLEQAVAELRADTNDH